MPDRQPHRQAESEIPEKCGWTMTGKTLPHTNHYADENLLRGKVGMCAFNSGEKIMRIILESNHRRSHPLSIGASDQIHPARASGARAGRRYLSFSEVDAAAMAASHSDRAYPWPRWKEVALA
ncbi:MAG: hypothetical protein ACM3NO_04805 [Deltaproteobacteria bacterium]